MTTLEAVEELTKAFLELTPVEFARLFEFREAGGKFLCGTAHSSGHFVLDGLCCPAVIAAGIVRPSGSKRYLKDFSFTDERSREDLLGAYSRLVLYNSRGRPPEGKAFEYLEALAVASNEDVYAAIDHARSLR